MNKNLNSNYNCYKLIENLGINNNLNLEKSNLPKLNLNISLDYDTNLEHHLHQKLTEFQEHHKELKKKKKKRRFFF